MSFDDILDQVGQFGPYQKLLVALLYMPCMFGAMQSLSYVFTSAIPKHRCFVTSCDNSSTGYCEGFLNVTTPYDTSSSSYSSCNLYSQVAGNHSSVSTTCPAYDVDNNYTAGCSRWKYDDSVYERTTVTQWDLVCDRAYEVALSQSVYMAGIMVGSVIYGMIADRFGRKIAILLGILVGSLMATGSPFVPNYPFFLVLRFFTAMSFQGLYQSSFVMSVELVGKSKRAFCGMLISIYYAVGEIILGITAYFLRDWELLQLVISAPPIIFLIYFWIIPESPRWLMSHNRITEAKETLERIAQSNSKTIPYHMLNAENSDIVEKDVDSSFEVSESSSIEPKEHHSILDLFRTPRLRWRSLNIFLNWLMNTIAYYGITMSTPSLGGNEFWNFVIVSAVEIPSYIFGMLVLDRLGRRYPLCGCMIVGGIAGTCTALVPSTPDYVWLSITLALIGKFGASAAFGIIYVFSAELFPTVVRNNGIGMSSMIGHIGGVVAPYIATLSSVSPTLPLVIFGVCSLFSGLAAFTLPETLGQQLPESLEDAENFGRKATFESAGATERLHLLSDHGPDGV